MSAEEETKITITQSFMLVKAGDTVVRHFYDIEMRLKVEKVDDKLIYTVGGWTFDRATGIEEDEELGMGVSFGVTCSNLIEVIPGGTTPEVI